MHRLIEKRDEGLSRPIVAFLAGVAVHALFGRINT